MHEQFEIRAEYDADTISIYQAFSKAIALPAIKHQRLVEPFLVDRMTWIKPSFLWMMYRSDWATRANQECILKIKIHRRKWEYALSEAILTTPERHVYPNAAQWRILSDRAKIKVQWDPERDLRSQRLNYRSIQVGITPVLAKEYASKWIHSIYDCTSLVREIQNLVLMNKTEEAQKLLPPEKIYTVSPELQRRLGIVSKVK